MADFTRDNWVSRGNFANSQLRHFDQLAESVLPRSDSLDIAGADKARLLCILCNFARQATVGAAANAVPQLGYTEAARMLAELHPPDIGVAFLGDRIDVEPYERRFGKGLARLALRLARSPTELAPGEDFPGFPIRLTTDPHGDCEVYLGGTKAGPYDSNKMTSPADLLVNRDKLGQILEQIGWKGLRTGLYDPASLHGEIIGSGSEGDVWKLSIGGLPCALKLYQSRPELDAFDRLSRRQTRRPDFRERFGISGEVARELDRMPLKFCRFKAIDEYAASRDYHLTALGSNLSLQELGLYFFKTDRLNPEKLAQTKIFVSESGVTRDDCALAIADIELAGVALQLFQQARTSGLPLKPDLSLGNFLVSGFDGQRKMLNLVVIDQGVPSPGYDASDSMLYDIYCGESGERKYYEATRLTFEQSPQWKRYFQSAGILPANELSQPFNWQRVAGSAFGFSEDQLTNPERLPHLRKEYLRTLE